MRYYNRDRFAFTRERAQDVNFGRAVILTGSEAVMLDALMQIQGYDVMYCPAVHCHFQKTARTALAVANRARRG